MNSTGSVVSGGSRDEIVAILLMGAAVAAAAGTGYLVGRAAAQKQALAALPAHAVVSPAPLKQIAEKAGMQPPSALAQIRKLEEEGKVLRVEMPEGPRYAVLPFIRCQWIDPDHGINTAWQSSQPVDWRFPLVSRIPDPPAQTFLLEWLDRAQARGLLPRYVSKFEPTAKPPNLQVVIYGSCSRGDAGPKSDLDILLVGNTPKNTMESLKDLAHEIALRGGRTPDVRIMDEKTWREATPAFKEAVRRDGKTVFTNDSNAYFLEQAVQVLNA